jgi:hypothetical protein
MELGSKVTALEEEIAVLKGEIKTILQEVRTAVLARENPFAVDAHQIPQVQELPAAPVSTPVPAQQDSSNVVQLQAAAPEPKQTEPQSYPPQPTVADEIGAARPTAIAPQAKRRWSVGALATLVAWTQETASRMNAGDLDIVLSLARYGGLIDEELEATLTRLSAPLHTPDQEPRRKGVSDYLLALRELSAVIEEAEDGYKGSGPVRRAS